MSKGSMTTCNRCMLTFVYVLFLSHISRPSSCKNDKDSKHLSFLDLLCFLKCCDFCFVNTCFSVLLVSFVCCQFVFLNVAFCISSHYFSHNRPSSVKLAWSPTEITFTHPVCSKAKVQDKTCFHVCKLDFWVTCYRNFITSN